MRCQWKRIIFNLFIGVLLCFSVFYGTSAVADIQVSMSADKTSVIPGEQVRIVISVQGVKNAQEPVFPESDAYQVYSMGRSSRFELINGKLNTSLDFNYTVVPSKKGNIRISPVPVKVGNKILKTNPLTLHVASSDSAVESEKAIFTSATVDVTEPFVNQQIIYTLRLFRRVQIRDARMEPLEFEGFHVENLGKEREYAQLLNGKKYHVTEIRFALFPQKSGILTIAPARLQCQVMYRRDRSRSPFDSLFDDPFFGRSEIKTEFFSTDPIRIHVKPLPKPKSTALTTPLVGRFSISAQLNQEEMTVGDSATLTISVLGRGNIQNIPEPLIPDLPEFKIYEDTPDLDIKMTLDGISGVKTFKKALVPLNPGEYKIPPIKIPYLDPNRGVYRIAATRSIPLRVIPGTEEETLHLVEGAGYTVNKEEIKMLGKDILPPKTTIKALRDQSVRWSDPMMLLLLIFPPLTFGVVFLWDRKKRHMETDQAYYRRKKAFKCWKRKRRAILSIADKDLNEFYSQTSRSLKEFIGDRISVAGQALTPREIDQKLGALDISKDLRHHLQEILHTLEKGVFGALHQNADERKDLLKDVEKVVNQLLRKT